MIQQHKILSILCIIGGVIALLVAGVGLWHFTNNAERKHMNITTERVEFQSENTPMVGTLHLPAGFSKDKTYPSVVVTGSWFTVKEQMPNLYAQRLAEQGFVALTFDFRYFGESGGEPRYYEMPTDKVIDITSAVSHLKSLPYIDQDKIAGLGICISAGMMATATTENSDIKALALVAPGLQNREIFSGAFGSDAAVQAKIDEGNAAREKYEATGEIDYVPLISTTDQTAAIVTPDATDYYLDTERGAIPEWENRFAVMSWAPIIEFDSVAIGRDVKTPTLMVHSETGANATAAHAFYENLTDIHKEEYWMPGTQYDFYDREPQVTKSVNAVSTFFKTELE